MKEVKLGVSDMPLIRNSSTLVVAMVWKINVIENLYKLCYKEGFNGLNIAYLGGEWVRIEFKKQAMCSNFKQYKVMQSLFKEIIPVKETLFLILESFG